MNRSAVARAPLAQRSRHLRPADDPIAQLAARGDVLALHLARVEAEHAERMDLLAQHLALVLAENEALRDRCDVLALAVDPLVGAHDAALDRELRRAGDNATLQARVDLMEFLIEALRQNRTAEARRASHELARLPR